MLGAFVAFSLLGGVLVASTPAEPATATPTWPLEVSDTAVFGVIADENGGLSLNSCTTGGSYNSHSMAYYLDENQVVRNELQSYGGKPQFCDRYGTESPDGVFLSYYPTSATTSVLTARKNNRQLWEISTSSPTDCDVTSWVTKFMVPASVSVGSDGNIYMILTTDAGDSAMACPERLFGVNATTGATIIDEPLTTPASPTYNKSQAWTYEDYILVLDRDGSVRKFEYDGDEVTNASYPYIFTPGSGKMFYRAAANADGTVYAVSATTGAWNAMTLLYHEDGGSTGSIYNSAHASRVVTGHTFNADGDFISFDGSGAVDIFDLSLGTVSTFTVTAPSGYPNSIFFDYVEDANGNAIAYRTSYNTSYTGSAVSVDFIDGATSAVTNLYFDSGTGDARPTTFPVGEIGRSIAGGYLYASLCEDQSSQCSGGSTPPDSWIHKISVGGFGEPVLHTFGQSGYESDELEYVAMGDSYSSGEGNPGFNPWTDRSGINECHRSISLSYAQWLVNYGDLDLHLTDYVACSGATTDTVLNGGSSVGTWDEPAQINSLTASTDRISLTIGGNDIGFKSILEACVKSPVNTSGWGCSSDTSVTDLVADRLDALDGVSSGGMDPNGRTIHSLLSVIQEIAEAAPNASIYIAGYPKLFGDSSAYYAENLDAPGDAVCPVTLSATVSYSDAQWLNDQANALNQLISDAVIAANVENIDITYVAPSLFEGRGLCDNGDAYLYGVELTGSGISSASMHPNEAGQTIAYALMFQSLMN